MNRAVLVLPVLFVFSAGLLGGCTASRCGSGLSADAQREIGHTAHAAYVDAINTNDVETIMGILTDDVVFMAPNAPLMEGKAAIRPWVEGYVNAFRSRWIKTTLEFVVAGDWAFEQYSYESADTPRAGGATLRDTGKGLIIYRLEDDGVWRVARDAWSSDLPAS